MTSHGEPLVEYYLRFCDAFVERLAYLSDDALLSAWHGRTERTQFWTREVLPGVAEALGLKLTTELFKVDAAMSVASTNGEDIPVVFIESENEATTASHEMRKLAAISCPLAVLITVVEWNPVVFPGKSCRDRLMSEWAGILQARSNVWARPGVIGVIVGEWGSDERLRFYRFGLAIDGSVRVPEATAYERHIPG